MAFLTSHPYADGRANPLRALHYALVGYVLLLCFSAVTASGIVKAMANATAIGVFALALTNWLFYKRKSVVSSGQRFFIALYYVGILGSVFFAFKGEDFVDVLKIAIAPFFFVIGADLGDELDKWSLRSRSAILLFLALIFLPLLAIAIQIGSGAFDPSASKQIGFFANRNNAGLYAVSLLCFYCVLTREPINNPLVYLGVGLMFGTLGLFLAVVFALFLSHGTLRYFIAGMVVAITGLVLLNFFPDAGIELRIKPVVDSIVLLLSGRIDLETVSYGELVALLDTQDLSFLFRLKHWLNLYVIFAESSIVNILFGLGAGASVQYSDMRLVPHNDYIRIMFEFGFITFLGFVGLMSCIVFSVKRGWLLVPLLVIVIYFFSENLINNYLAMALFYLSSGTLSVRSRDS